jgi:hypothetical protein
MISDAQLILGFSRHLTAYSVSPVHAELETLRFAGQVYEMAWRLRNAQVSSAERVRAIGIDAKIGPLDLDRYVLPTMEQLRWVQCDRRPDRTLVSVSAYIPPNTELLAATDQLLGILLVTPVQRAALEIMRATSIQPLERQAALQAGSGHGDEAAELALSCLITVNLVREVPSEDGRAAVFNPNIWIGDSEMVTAALRTEDARVQREVGALIEEIMASPGIPEELVTSTEQRWIDFAVSAGLVERSQVVAASDKKFLFTPHLHRDPFGTDPRDPSGHIRQLVGSMIYASTFASWKLNSPGAFLYVLIRDGEAGQHERIAEDYAMLETAGTIEVVGEGRGARMRLLQADVAEQALKIIDSRGNTTGVANTTFAGIGEQRSYNHLERERAQVASAVALDDADSRRFMSALRDTTARRNF